jgi:hypothetical protein
LDGEIVADFIGKGLRRMDCAAAEKGEARRPKHGKKIALFLLSFD